MEVLRRRFAAVAAVAALVGTIGFGDVTASAQDDPAAAAGVAGGWLADQVGPDGSVTGGFSVAGDTGSTALALAMVGVEGDAFDRAVDYLADNVEDYVAPDAFDNPGRLGRLLMVIEAAGGDPGDFGGIDPQQRLLDSIQGSGVFGADASVQSNFNQSLGVLGLAAVGAPVPASASSFLEDQQCPAGSPAGTIGGWGFVVRASPGDPCGTGDPDTNTSAVAIQALAATGASDPVDDGLDYLDGLQGADGGFSFAGGGDSDPNSTGVALQAIVAGGEDPASGRWSEAGGDPYTSLLGWQLGCEAPEDQRGAFASTFSEGAPDLLATLDAIAGAASAPYPPAGPVSFAPAPELDCGGGSTTTTTTSTPETTPTTTATPEARPAIPAAATPAFTG